MIQASELRISNYTEQGKIIELRHIVCRIEYISDKIRTALITYESLKPIELTEEILLKCGFKVENGEYLIAYHDKDLSFQIHSRDRINYWLSNYKNGFTAIKHLHQLQNLYSALTGTELKINL